MFDHVSIGVCDLARSKRFYDAALRSFGYVCLIENSDALGYGREKIAFWIGRAEDRKSTRLNSSHRSLSRMPSSA